MSPDAAALTRHIAEGNRYRWVLCPACTLRIFTVAQALAHAKASQHPATDVEFLRAGEAG